MRKFLIALFGTGITTILTRSIILLAVIGTLAIIGAGLFTSNTSLSSAPAISTNSSQPVVGLQPGNAAPNFTLSTLDGKKVSLSDFRGRPVLLNFWYTTCPGCNVEIPGLQKYYAAQLAAGKDLVILGVNVVDDKATTLDYVRHHGLTYTIVLDPNQQVEALYNINATPTSYFINRQGIVRLSVVAPLDDSALQQDIALIS